MGRLITARITHHWRGAHHYYDLHQHCWMTLLKRIDLFDQKQGAFSSFVYGVVDSSVRDYFRREQKVELARAALSNDQ